MEKENNPKNNIQKNPAKKSGQRNCDHLKGWKPGKSGNPKGRPKGQRNYSTIYREALIKIGEAKKMTPEEIEELMEETGISKALEGDFKFFQDIRDRVHGRATQKIENTHEIIPNRNEKVESLLDSIL